MLPRRLPPVLPTRGSHMRMATVRFSSDPKDKKGESGKGHTGSGPFGKKEDRHENEYFRRLQNEMLKKFKALKDKASGNPPKDDKK